MIRRLPASPIVAVLISVALLGSANAKVPDELDPQDLGSTPASASRAASPAATSAASSASSAPQASIGADSAAPLEVPASSPQSPETLQPTGALPLNAVTPSAPSRAIVSADPAAPLASPSAASATPTAATASTEPAPLAAPAVATPPPASPTPAQEPTAVPAQRPPLAPEDPVKETFWGATVVDRYRYLEDASDDRTKAFYETQGDATAQYLRDLNPARTRLFDRIQELDRSSISVGDVTRTTNAYFYQRQNPSDETPALFTRPASGGAAKLLVDPMREKRGKTHATLDWSVPSADGRYVAYGLSTGGSEASVLHVVDAKTGKRAPETIDRTRFGASGWLPDNRSVVYIRLPKVTKDTPIVDRERFLRAYVHRLGTPVASDRAIFGWKVDPKVPFGPDDVPSVSVAPGSKYALAVIGHGVQNELTVYAAPYAALAANLAAPEAKADSSEAKKPAVPWKKIVDVRDGVTAIDVRGDNLYALSHKDASNYRVRVGALDGSRPLRDVVKPGRAVLQQIGVARDGLYVRALDGGIGRIAKIPYGAKSVDPSRAYLRLPYEGNVTSIVTDPRVAGITFGLTGWTHSLLWYRTDGRAKIADTKLKPLSPIDASAYESKEVLVRGDDGTEIPLSIIMKKGTVLDGTHPTYLQGYGAYGQILSPYFSTTRIAWLERGGVYAVAHVRGGGEFGENWHKAAMRAKKKRSIDDFIACAKYLINEKYTSPKYLGAEGTSAGGIVVGGAITRAPQLFAAVLDVVGVSNALRSEFSENGPGNIPEFGTVKNRDEFFALYDIDAVAQVKNGTAYPAVMLITGLNDPRVPSWELGKFAASLQRATTSGKPVLLRIDKDAGHGFLAASRTQTEELLTDEYAFLLAQMGRL